MANSETILSANTHQGDSVIQTLTGEKYRGDGYYGRSDGFHTVQYNLNGFLGTVNIQATLAISPSEDDWFTVHTQAYTDNSTGSYMTNFTGNYVWIRAHISNWSDGSVNSIKLNH
jgi:hypothetical protein